MLLSGTLLLPDAASAHVRLRKGWIRIEGERIAEVGPGDPPGTPDMGSAETTLLCPGFTDCHLHLPQFDSIGADGLELLDWLDRIIFPAEARWEDADYAGAMTERICRRLASHGTTGLCAYATVHHEAARAAVAALHGSGLRAAVGQVLMDRGAPAELIRPAAQLLREAAKLRGLEAGRVQTVVTPRFAITCSEELLRGCAELARASGSLVQTHFAETRRECARVRELFGGLDYTEVYRRAGLLGNRTILAHGVWLDDADRAVLNGSTIAHCPTANLFLRSGAMDLQAHNKAGVNVCLGSDIAGGPDVCMVRVAGAMVETAKTLGLPPPNAAEAWWRITRGNALALGWHDGGLLEQGAQADLLVVEPDVPWRSASDPLAMLLYAWDDRWLTRTFAAGRTVWSRESMPAIRGPSAG